MKLKAVSALAVSLYLCSPISKAFAAGYYCTSDMRLKTIYFSPSFELPSAQLNEVRDAWRAYLKQTYNFDPPADHQSACFGGTTLEKTQADEQQRINIMKASGKWKLIQVNWTSDSARSTPQVSAQVTPTHPSMPAHPSTQAPNQPAAQGAQRTQAKVLPKTSIENAPASLLIFAAGKNGTYHESTDGETMTRVRKELARRANELHDGDAAYALARDMQYPSIFEWIGDRSAAEPWYVLSYKLGNVNGKYRVGSFYTSGEFKDIPRNVAYGNQLIEEARSTPGWDPDMLMPPDRGGIEPEHHFRPGSHNYNPSGSGNSRDALIPVMGALLLGNFFNGLAGNAGPPTIGTGAKIQCNIEETVIEAAGTPSAHPVTYYRTGYGSDCH